MWRVLKHLCTRKRRAIRREEASAYQEEVGGNKEEMYVLWQRGRALPQQKVEPVEACRSCQAHRLVAAAALSLYAVVLVAAMCACMSVLAAAVRAAICVLAQATAATAVLAALAGQ